jgi:hypothetical protein
VRLSVDRRALGGGDDVATFILAKAGKRSH